MAIYVDDRRRSRRIALLVTGALLVGAAGIGVALLVLEPLRDDLSAATAALVLVLPGVAALALAIGACGDDEKKTSGDTAATQSATSSAQIGWYRARPEPEIGIAGR